MKKVYKLGILAILLVIIVGSIITVYSNYKREKKKEKKEQPIVSTDTYKIKRKNNKYIIESTNPGFYDKEIKKFFYDDKNIYLYLTDSETATVLKYSINNNKITVLFEDTKELYGEIVEYGDYFIINNKVYSKKFEYNEEYTKLIENGKDNYYDNFKYKLIKNENKLIKKSIENEEEVTLVEDSEEIKYDFFIVKNNNKRIIVKKTIGDKVTLGYIDNDNKVSDTNITYNTDNTYILLNDKYILVKSSKEDKNNYKVYNIENSEQILNIEDDNHYIFNDKYFMYEDDKSDIYIKNYETQEERKVFNNKNTINSFMESSDSYSLVIYFNEDKTSFYVIYL